MCQVSSIISLFFHSLNDLRKNPVLFVNAFSLMRVRFFSFLERSGFFLLYGWGSCALDFRQESYAFSQILPFVRIFPIFDMIFALFYGFFNMCRFSS
jgi:hypothetical protein